MRSLRELQLAFVDAALFDDVEALAGCIEDRDLSAADRIGIYANNALENFIGALAAGFPVVQSLGGEQWFRQTAQRFWRACPSRAGNLHYVGERFAAYLSETLAARPHTYFADVARLEWAYQETAVAADADDFQLAALAHVAAADYDRLLLSLHPSVRLVDSPYPIFDLWAAHQPDADLPDTFDLDSGPQRVVLSRHEQLVVLRRVDLTTWTFLQGIATGASLGEIVTDTLTIDADFDLAATLPRCIRLGLLAGFSIAPLPSTQGDAP